MRCEFCDRILFKSSSISKYLQIFKTDCYVALRVQLWVTEGSNAVECWHSGYHIPSTRSTAGRTSPPLFASRAGTLVSGSLCYHKTFVSVLACERKNIHIVLNGDAGIFPSIATVMSRGVWRSAREGGSSYANSRRIQLADIPRETTSGVVGEES